MAMSNGPNKAASHHRYLSSPFSSHSTPSHGLLYVKEKLIKPPHLWRVIKPQCGAEGGQRQRSKKVPVSVLPSPSVINLHRFSAGRLTTRLGRGKQRFGCDECARSQAPHSMLIRAFARAQNRESGQERTTVTLCIMKSETFALGARRQNTRQIERWRRLSWCGVWIDGGARLKRRRRSLSSAPLSCLWLDPNVVN